MIQTVVFQTRNLFNWSLFCSILVDNFFENSDLPKPYLNSERIAFQLPIKMFLLIILLK